MKYLLILLFSLPLCLFAQYNSKPIGKVTYLHETRTQGGQELNGQASLLFNADHSLYIHEGAPERDSAIANEKIAFGKVIGDPEGFPIYKRHRERTMTCKITCNGLYKKEKYCLVSDTLGAIDWRIESDVRRFGSYTCQKATGEFRGRTYEAWFAPDIPIPSGPFKLGGLPGLILEAKTTDGAVKFTFIQLETGENIAGEITLPFGQDLQMSHPTFIEQMEIRNKQLMEQAAAKGFKTIIFLLETIEIWKQ